MALTFWKKSTPFFKKSTPFFKKSARFEIFSMRPIEKSGHKDRDFIDWFGSNAVRPCLFSIGAQIRYFTIQSSMVRDEEEKLTPTFTMRRSPA